MKDHNDVVKFFIFGDSISVGQGVSINHGWVFHAARDIEYLNQKYNLNILVANSSINGNTTRQALERMPYDIQSHGVDVLSIQFGLNDCNFWDTDKGLPRVSPQAFKANLEEIIARGKVFGAKSILLHTNHPTLRDRILYHSKTKYQSYDENNKLYSQIIRDIAEGTQGVTLIDIEQIFHSQYKNHSRSLEELLLPDGLHLSVLGHDLYYKTIKPYINEVLNNVIKKEAYTVVE
ncbi:SGNH/GDSL hydrolase family protein [Legionella spiritensis]|uniref:SGNH/GDSL hydrolase family protein n=1 Tax=Legionella spiritensis TaxID=452 RepID=UPI000F6CD745|nr:SGNH/GDSL hydrolase family protein [Legionella spiritensis]VEG89666.1 Acyl-CoA thioesterase I precursor [Legionella spiritensis]